MCLAAGSIAIRMERVKKRRATMSGTQYILFPNLIDILLIPIKMLRYRFAKVKVSAASNDFFRHLPISKFAECAIFAGKIEVLRLIIHHRLRFFPHLIAFQQREPVFHYFWPKERLTKKTTLTQYFWVDDSDKNQVLKLPTITSFLWIKKSTPIEWREEKKNLFIVFSWVNSSSTFNWHFYLWHIQSKISIIFQRFQSLRWKKRKDFWNWFGILTGVHGICDVRFFIMHDFRSNSLFKWVSQ